MKIELGSFVEISPGSMCLYDENNRRFDTKNLSRLAILVAVHRKQGEKQEATTFTPVLLVSDGHVLMTAPVKRGWHIPDCVSVMMLGSAGLTAHFNMDSFVEECFTAGYTKIKVEHNGYGSMSFGATGYFSKEKEPRFGSWPALWNLAEKYGLYAGCGGYHSAQMCRFIPTGKYKFGELSPI